MTETLAAHAERTIAAGSKSFAAAARLFASAMRHDVLLLYCWCRHCDDVTDGQTLGHGRHRPATPGDIARLREQSLDALAGRPGEAMPMRALAEVARRHGLPRDVVLEHLRGFALDAAGWRPRTLGETLDYCFCAAGSVGVMMARIMGVSDRATLLRASDLGIAFQLTNIARDLAEDSAVGRCYVPAVWLAEAGLEGDELADPAAAAATHALACRLVNVAEPYYASARIGIRALPPRAAWAITSAARIYRDIGLAVERAGPAGAQRRMSTGRARKLWRIITGASAVLPSHNSGPARHGNLFTPEVLAPPPARLARTAP